MHICFPLLHYNKMNILTATGLNNLLEYRDFNQILLKNITIVLKWFGCSDIHGPDWN